MRLARWLVQMDGNLRFLRESKALSLEDLAKAAGVSASTVYRFEHGTHTPRPSTIRKLSRALGVEPEVLTSRQGRIGI